MNVISSILKYRCPRCRETRMFAQPFVFTNPLDMHDNCSHCGQSFEPEPGFYYGAMFLSYSLYSFLLLPIAFISGFGFDWPTWKVMLLVVVVGLVTYFKILRLSRSLWIHIVVGYNPDFKESIED